MYLLLVHIQMSQFFDTFYDERSSTMHHPTILMCKKSWAYQIFLIFSWTKSCNFSTWWKLLKRYVQKISPVGDWRSTSLEWPWPWIRPYGTPSCITHRPLPTYQISLRSEEKNFESHHWGFGQVQSHVTKTRTNIKNPARSNLDIVL